MNALAPAALGLLLVTCSLPGGESPSPSVSGSPLAAASGKLDAEVAMPAGFPGDVPVYPKARLTAAAAFPTDAPTSWGMEWETLDTVAKVQPYYADKMNRDDWTISFTTNTTERFTATFRRRSDSQIQGTLESNSASGVTKILMSLLSPRA